MERAMGRPARSAGFRWGVAAATLAVASGAAWFGIAAPTPRGTWTGLVVFVLPAVVVSAALLVLGILVLRRRLGPAAFALAGADRAFRAQPRAYLLWMLAVMPVTLSWIFGSLVFSLSTWDDADSDWQAALVKAVFVAFLGAIAVAYVALVGVHLYALGSGWPMVELTPDELRVRVLYGSLAVPWDALRPGYPHQPPPRADTLPLTIDRPDLVRRRGLVLFPLSSLDIHPWFLADAIRYYVSHPEHRPAIGTPAEHARLRDLFYAGGAPPQSPFDGMRAEPQERADQGDRAS